MKKLLFFLPILLTVWQTALAQCSPNIANIYAYTFNGIGYEIVKENLSWTDAAACAVSRGGKLIEINSKAEQDTLFVHINNAGIVASNTVAPDGGGASYVWLGGNDLSTEGKWVWDGDHTGSSDQFWQGTSTGNPVGGLYSNWGNEPDNWNNQDGLGFAFTNWPLGLAGQWNDVKETNLLYYVIEYAHSTSVPEVKAFTFSVYPNPTQSELNFGTLSGEAIIYDLAGKQLESFSLKKDQSINLNYLPPGSYTIEVNNETGIHRSKFLKY